MRITYLRAAFDRGFILAGEAIRCVSRIVCVNAGLDPKALGRRVLVAFVFLFLLLPTAGRATTYIDPQVAWWGAGSTYIGGVITYLPDANAACAANWVGGYMSGPMPWYGLTTMPVLYDPTESGYPGHAWAFCCSADFPCTAAGDIQGVVYTVPVCPAGWEVVTLPNALGQYIIRKCQPVASCPANSTGTPPSCTCDAGYKFDDAGTSCVPDQCLPPNVINSSGQCVPPETYTIKLDLKSATLEPSGTASQTAKTSQSFTATVTGDKNGAKAGAQVTIKAEVKQGSGGHDHTDELQRPKGYLGQGSAATLCDPNALQPQACITGTTDANGQFTFVFSTPEPSGKHTITATCDVCKDNQDQAKINVKVEGLVSLSGSSTDYVLVGDTPTHSDNHYLKPTAKALAERLAIAYRKKFPKDPRLHFNDASLIDGGVLDICTEKETSEDCAYTLLYNPICQLQPNGTYACSWSRPHIEHRRGSVIDVRANNIKPKAPNYSTSIPKRNEKEFLSIANDIGLNPGRPHSPKSSNRHWHIKLLGVAE